MNCLNVSDLEVAALAAVNSNQHFMLEESSEDEESSSSDDSDSDVSLDG